MFKDIYNTFAYSSMFNNDQIKLQSQILVGVQFFFSAAVVGLTNRPSVRLSNAGAPLTQVPLWCLAAATKTKKTWIIGGLSLEVDECARSFYFLHIFGFFPAYI